jgi:hypothetical protein
VRSAASEGLGGLQAAHRGVAEPLITLHGQPGQGAVGGLAPYHRVGAVFALPLLWIDAAPGDLLESGLGAAGNRTRSRNGADQRKCEI